MVNAIIYLQGKPDDTDLAPDIFKISGTFRDLEIIVERTNDEDTDEPGISLTFISKNKQSMTCTFSLKSLRTRIKPTKFDKKEDGDFGSPVFDDLNKLDREINYLQKLIVDRKWYCVYIYISLDFLHNPDSNTPMEIEVPEDFIPTKNEDWGPFNYSYCKYKDCAENEYSRIHEGLNENEPTDKN